MDRKETELDTGGAKELSRSETKTDSRAEALLEQGEDLFERGLLGQAIHLWTRVLFLDRGNRDARLRIEEARGLLAERQRVLDARAVDARRLFEEGEIEQARAVVRSVLIIDAHHADALRLSEELAALERRIGIGAGASALDEPAVAETRPDTSSVPELGEADDGSAAATEIESEREPEPGPQPDSEPKLRSDAMLQEMPAPAGGLLVRVSKQRGRDAGEPGSPAPLKVAAFLLAVGIGFAAGGLFLYYNWEAIVSDGTAAGVAVDGTRATSVSVGAGPVEDLSDERRGPAAPDLSELRYYNGVRLFDKGRYREALAELGRVDRGSAVASRARGLILRIEERLLRGAEETNPDTVAGRETEPDTEDQEQ